MQTLNMSSYEFFKLKNLNFKYQIFTPSDCKYIGIRKVEFVAKTYVHCSREFES